MHRHRRPVLLNHHRPAHHVPGPELGTPVDRCEEGGRRTAEYDWPSRRRRLPGRRAWGRQRGCAVPAFLSAGTAYPDAGASPPGRHELGQFRSLDGPDAGDPQVDPLDLLARVAAEVVSIERAVRVVERARRSVSQFGAEPPVAHWDAHFEGLAVVPQVRRPAEAVLIWREALGG